jgi:hypothetical protein
VAAVCGGVASTDPSEARYQQDMAGLGHAARLELDQRARAVLALWRAGEAVDPQEVHRLAGLAAQFGWAAVAEAADALEAGLTAEPEVARQAVEDLERALAELADGA